MDASALMTNAHSHWLAKLDTVWRLLQPDLNAKSIADLIFPLLFLRLASTHADVELAETADICWAELTETPFAQDAYQQLRIQLYDPHTWAEYPIFAALPAAECLTAAQLQAVLDWLQDLDMYALHSQNSGEFWEACLHTCAAQTPQLQALCPPPALINSLVALLQPRLEEHCYDPVAGSSAFLVAAHAYVQMLHEEQHQLPPEHSCRISAQVHSAQEARLSLANLRLHDVPMSDLHLWQATQTQTPSAVDCLFANFTAPACQATLPNLFNQALESLSPNGRALLLIHDHYLTNPAYADWRRAWLQNYQLHTLLRLPSGVPDGHCHALFIAHQGATEQLWGYDLRAQLPDLNAQPDQLAQALGHFSQAYGEEPLPDTAQREARAHKDARLRRFALDTLGATMDFTGAWLTSDSLPPLPGLHSQAASAAKRRRGLLADALQELHNLDNLLNLK